MPQYSVKYFFSGAVDLVDPVLLNLSATLSPLRLALRSSALSDASSLWLFWSKEHKKPFSIKTMTAEEYQCTPRPFCRSLICPICFVSCVSRLFREGRASQVVIKHRTLIHVQMHPGLFETKPAEGGAGRKLIINRRKQGGWDGEGVRALLESMIPAQDFVGQWTEKTCR